MKDTAGQHTVGSLAAAIDGEVVGDAHRVICRPANISNATPESITFVRNAKFAPGLAGVHPGAILIARNSVESARPYVDAEKTSLIIVADADLAMIRTLQAFAPPSGNPPPGRAASATVAPTAEIDPTAAIGPGCIVGEGAKIGANTVLVGHVYVGRDAVIGRDCLLYPGVRFLDRCVMHPHCILHAGVVIGADGFGYRPTPRGAAKIPHIGNVVIQEGVEIGANSCVDRAMFDSTLIGAGTKIDNLCQIGHNCVIGRGCIICGGCGLAGSVTLGDGAILGGQVGIADNVSIGAGAQLGGGAGVGTNVPPGASWLGTPAGPATEMRRNYIAFSGLSRTLASIKRQLRERLDGA